MKVRPGGGPGGWPVISIHVLHPTAWLISRTTLQLAGGGHRKKKGTYTSPSLSQICLSLSFSVSRAYGVFFLPLAQSRENTSPHRERPRRKRLAVSHFWPWVSAASCIAVAYGPGGGWEWPRVDGGETRQGGNESSGPSSGDVHDCHARVRGSLSSIRRRSGVAGGDADAAIDNGPGGDANGTLSIGRLDRVPVVIGCITHRRGSDDRVKRDGDAW